MATIPRVIKFGFKDIQQQEQTVTATCLFCKKKTPISDKVGTTSNFVKHLKRIHPSK